MNWAKTLIRTGVLVAAAIAFALFIRFYVSRQPSTDEIETRRRQISPNFRDRTGNITKILLERPREAVKETEKQDVEEVSITDYGQMSGAYIDTNKNDYTGVRKKGYVK